MKYLLFILLLSSCATIPTTIHYEPLPFEDVSEMLEADTIYEVGRWDRTVQPEELQKFYTKEFNHAKLQIFYDQGRTYSIVSRNHAKKKR